MIDLGRFGSLRLHHWFRSDDARATHDHPSDFITLVLRGEYLDYQVLEDQNGQAIGSYTERMRPFKIRYRKAEHRHTVQVQPGGCWTLLYFWPERRRWGFYIKRKLDGKLKFVKSNKYFLEHGHHPCEQP